MTKQTFSDFDEFSAAINGVGGRIIPTARSELDWWVQVALVGGVAVQQVQIGGAAVCAGDGTDNAITLGAPLTVPQCIRIDGTSLDDNSFILVKEGQPFTFAARQITRWAGITVPLEHPALDHELIDALKPAPFDDEGGTHARTELPYIAEARQLIARLCMLDENGQVLEPLAARAAEEEIMTLASRVLEASRRFQPRRVGRPQVCRSRIIAKTQELIENNHNEPLFIQDLCRAAQVSERTLRNVFQEYFGVGPLRLLNVRRLRAIRTALLNAEATEHTVTTIAARFGVWDFSLFSRNYKALFGETPLETLRNRPAARSPTEMNPPWVQFASRRLAGVM